MYIQFDGGSAVVYSCTGAVQGSSNQCDQINVDDPEGDPACVPVEKYVPCIAALVGWFHAYEIQLNCGYGYMIVTQIRK